MRRSLIALTLALAAAAALASAAFAKEGGVELSSTPFGMKPGEPWSGTLTVIGDPGLLAHAKPSITATNLDTGVAQTFDMVAPAKIPTTSESRSWVFQVTFPEPGRYAYKVSDGVTDREYAYPPVRIVGSGAAVPLPVAAGNSFPLWAAIAGSFALLLAAAGGGFYVRRRRFGLSH